MKKYAGLLILSWLIVATILTIAENSTSHQDRELTEEYEFHRKQDSLARINEIKKLSEIYGQKKVGMAIYSCVCLEDRDDEFNLDSLCIGYIPNIWVIDINDVQTILQGRIKIGFNFLQCIEALGYPEDTYITVTAENRYADWYYDNGYTLHLKNLYLSRYSIR